MIATIAHIHPRYENLTAHITRLLLQRSTLPNTQAKPTLSSNPSDTE